MVVIAAIAAHVVAVTSSLARREKSLVSRTTAVWMGFRIVAIARGADKGSLAKKLGAHIYINSTSQSAAEELTRPGGAKVILATVTEAKSMSSVVSGLGIDGKLLEVGASSEPIEEIQPAVERAPDDRNLPAGKSR